MTRHVPTRGMCPELLLFGPGDVEVQLLTLTRLSISATPESLHINLGETTHSEWTFQVLLSCVGQMILKGRISLVFSMTLKQCWIILKMTLLLLDVCSQAESREGILNIFQAFRNWLEHHILFWLACYPFAEYLNFFLPFIDSDGSKFPWVCSFHMSSKGPFSFCISSDLQLTVLSPSDFFQTYKIHFWNPYQQPLCLTEIFQNLPQSSTFLQILYHWAMLKNKKKPSRNWPLLIKLTKKGNVSFSCPVSLHESVFSCLTLYIQALRGRDCHFNLYFSVLSTTAHDEASGHYSNINSSNKIKMMAFPKVWLEKTIWSLHFSGPLSIQGQGGERAELSQ